MATNYYGMTPVQFGGGLQGLLLLPKGYDATKKYPLIFHFCGNGETQNYGLTALFNTGFGRQQMLGRIIGTIAENVINIIVQSPSSEAIGQPGNFNIVWDYMIKNYSVDISVDENGLYKFIALIGLSQGAKDAWNIRTWDPSNTAYGVAKNGLKIKYCFMASIPGTWPDAATYARASKSVYHFTHGSADVDPCKEWPAIDMNTALNKNGAISTFEDVPGAGHSNDVWDRAWNPLAKKEWNIYAMVQDGWNGGEQPAYKTATFTYPDNQNFVKYEPNGYVDANGVYYNSAFAIVVPIQIF